MLPIPMPIQLAWELVAIGDLLMKLSIAEWFFSCQPPSSSERCLSQSKTLPPAWLANSSLPQPATVYSFDEKHAAAIYVFLSANGGLDNQEALPTRKRVITANCRQFSTTEVS